MKMQDHLDACKRRAHQIKSDYPLLGYMERLDIAAKEQGFDHYTALKKLHELLGANVSPSRVAIVRAGGNSDNSPYLSLSTQIGIRSGIATPVS